MSATKTTRRTAIFWLASGGIFFFMDMQILGESAIAAQPVEQARQASVAPGEVPGLASPAADLAGGTVAVGLVVAD